MSHFVGDLGQAAVAVIGVFDRIGDTGQRAVESKERVPIVSSLFGDDAGKGLAWRNSLNLCR